MFWPFKRKPRQPTAWDEYEKNLVAQGLDPKKVRRATNLVKRLAKAGVLPFDHETGRPRPGLVMDPRAHAHDMLTLDPVIDERKR
jgi:hypothetical protein